MRVTITLLMTGLTLLATAARAAEEPKAWNFVGVAQASASFDAQSRVTGPVTRVAVKEGASVARGDLLLEIDPRPYQLDLNAAVARVKGAEAKLQATKIETANVEKLMQKKVVSSLEFSLAEAKLSESEAAMAVAKVELERAQLNLSWTQIKSPIDGQATHLATSEGKLVTDQSRLLTVLTIDPLCISFKVPETLLLQLRQDGLADPSRLSITVGFATEKDFPHSAKLELIDSEVDPSIGAVRFRATMANPKSLFSPGMSARVRVTAAP